jgi:hypothetical protein
MLPDTHISLAFQGKVEGISFLHFDLSQTFVLDRSGNFMSFEAVDGSAKVVGHDIALENVAPRKSVFGQGFPARVDVVIINQGFYAETFNVTVYANNTVIGKLTVYSLASGDSSSLVFEWNTSDFAKGKYTIKAVADPVQGETFIDDNTLVDGLVFVGIPGDVDASGIVNMLDLYYIALHYGANRQDPSYVANYDIDDNGIINMLDLYIAATHYGQHDP